MRANVTTDCVAHHVELFIFTRVSRRGTVRLGREKKINEHSARRTHDRARLEFSSITDEITAGADNMRRYLQSISRV